MRKMISFVLITGQEKLEHGKLINMVKDDYSYVF